MRVDKKYRLHKAAAKDLGRYAMNGVSLELRQPGDPEMDVEEGERAGLAVATNGRILAVVPVGLAEDDEPGLVPAEAFQAATKGAGGSSVIRANGDVTVTNGKSLTVHARPEGEFPRWRQVLPAAGKLASWRLRLNPSLLWDLAQAIGWNKDEQCIALTLMEGPKGRPDVTRPIHVEHQAGGFGCLMPITRDKDEPGPDVALALAGGPVEGKALADYSSEELATELDRRTAKELGLSDVPTGNVVFLADPELESAREELADAEREAVEASWTGRPVDAAELLELEERVSRLELAAAAPRVPAVEPEEVDELEPIGGGVELRLNEERNGVELVFDEKPDADVRAELKTAGFRWHRRLGLWYGKRTPDRLAFAARLVRGAV